MSDAITPFTVNIAEPELQDLRRRLQQTRWPERETCDDWSQGMPLAYTRELADYWATDYDWRRFERKLNSWPQFITCIDNLDIHFIHCRSPHEDALPLIISYGWPGTPPPMAAKPKMPFTWWHPHCPASIFPANPRPPVLQ
jgi:hypothetical protein